MLFPTLLCCLNQVMKISNFVKTLALNTRLFDLLCEELGLDLTVFLKHAEMRRLSCGNVTKNVFELRAQLLIFLIEKIHDDQEYLKNDKFISKSAYLSNAFGEPNLSSLAFIKSEGNVAEYISKIPAFERK